MGHGSWSFSFALDMDNIKKNKGAGRKTIKARAQGAGRKTF